MAIYLMKPSKELLESVATYKKAFLERNECIDGGAFLAEFDDLKQWLMEANKREKMETVQDGLVCSTLFLGIRERDGKLVGMVDIRHELNEYLFNFGGHIGYSVHLEERRKGYAKEMLKLALKKCRQMEIDKVLVVCKKDNTGSRKTIEGNDGIFEKECIDLNGDVLLRYWFR